MHARDSKSSLTYCLVHFLQMNAISKGPLNFWFIINKIESHSFLN